MLVASGHDPEQFLDRWTWRQVALFAESVVRQRAEMLNAVLSPALAAVGSKYKPAEVERAPGARGRGRRTTPAQSAEARQRQREARWYAFAAATGVPIIHGPGDTSGQGSGSDGGGGTEAG